MPISLPKDIEKVCSAIKNCPQTPLEIAQSHAEFVVQMLTITAAICGAIGGSFAYYKAWKLEGNKAFDREYGESFVTAVSKMVTLITTIEIIQSMPSPNRENMAMETIEKTAEYFSPLMRSIRHLGQLEDSPQIESAADELAEFSSQALQLNTQATIVDTTNLIVECDKRLKMLRDHNAYLSDNYRKILRRKKWARVFKRR